MVDYKEYVALITQTGTSAPVATVIKNTLSGTPVWGYASPGSYALVLANEFTVNKTVAFASSGAQLVGTMLIYPDNANQILLFTGSTDGRIGKVSIRIIVYD